MDVRIGRVIKPHGVRGEVVVDPTTDAPEERFAVGETVRGRRGAQDYELTVASVRPHQGRLLIRFEEVSDRTAAERLRGIQFFAAPREGGPGYYDHDLEGLVVLREGTRIGRVSGVIHPAGRVLLEVSVFAAPPSQSSVGSRASVDPRPMSHASLAAPECGRSDSDPAVVDFTQRTVLVPFVSDIVPEVDLAAGTLTVTPPEGLFEL